MDGTIFLIAIAIVFITGLIFIISALIYIIRGQHKENDTLLENIKKLEDDSE